ncbi:MAG: hypothetical protein LBR75_05840 [Prevotellaceae bacterium]|jgi:hypothetical protein|nr:hypothetical protein [Prevotellaceae bacterium]
MKKLVLFFAAATAVAFASCGPKAQEAEVVEPVVEEATIVEEAIVAPADTAAVVADTTAVVAQ